jgi:hypothetical protein
MNSTRQDPPAANDEQYGVEECYVYDPDSNELRPRVAVGPDGDFVIDTLPGAQQSVSVSAFSAANGRMSQPRTL